MSTPKRRLVTGHGGFVGQYAARAWPQMLTLPSDTEGHNIDLRHADKLAKAVRDSNPDEVVHLAGISFVPDSIKNPLLTYEVNFLGTLNLLQALADCGFTGRMVFVSSGDPYGLVPQNELPITEARALAPRNPYAVSKAAAEALCYQWSQTSKFEVMIARPFNHIGPAQSEKFAISDFAKQIAEIKAGVRSPELKVGNIDVTRDFTDVRDIVRAYDAILAKGENGETYNVCSGQERSIRSLLERLLELSDVRAEIMNDQTRWRASDQPRVVASAAKLHQHTGWHPVHELDHTLLEISKFWENQIVK
jgi:GDP-4-dehydro-6-deoxy-D-mannose reductase